MTDEERVKFIEDTAYHYKEHDFYTTLQYEDYLWLIEKVKKANKLDRAAQDYLFDVNNPEEAGDSHAKSNLCK